jgi:DivIVA domain-containing protein
MSGCEEGDRMSPTELDVPLVPSAEQIRRRMFASVRRGFDPDQVRDYLEQIANQVERLEQELKEARLEAEAAKSSAASKTQAAAEAKQDPYEGFTTRMADLIRAADEQAQKLLADAHTEAARTLSEARSEADRIRTDAQSRAEEARYQGSEALRRAREEADRALTGLSSRREKLILQLQEMQSRLLGVARELETAIDPAGDPASELFSERSPSSPAPSSPIATPAPPRPPSPAITPTGFPTTAGSSDPVDPRYEDLWASPEKEGGSPEASGEAGTVDLTMSDIPQIEIDLGEESAEGERPE